MTLHHLGNRLLVVPLDLEIGHLAIALRGLDPGVSQEILDRHQVRIGIEQLRSHRVTQLMTAYFQSGFLGVVLHAFLDSAHGYGIALAAPLIHQEQTFDPREGSEPQVLHQGLLRIVAEINNPVLGTLAVVNDEL